MGGQDTGCAPRHAIHSLSWLSTSGQTGRTHPRHAVGPAATPDIHSIHSTDDNDEKSHSRESTPRTTRKTPDRSLELVLAARQPSDRHRGLEPEPSAPLRGTVNGASETGQQGCPTATASCQFGRAYAQRGRRTGAGRTAAVRVCLHVPSGGRRRFEPGDSNPSTRSRCSGPALPPRST